ncbi:hypothetical protein BpHYR1_003312 [Brachionus plicatilis]|uniref:Uncharacterized protein n=1 Tax=Brachionus plicatilis TaxID=10195 RepID=A0A3M7Q6I3_BRAPC|nr:hypothetical protein BpHYR1_003312 [Brachionus plicatilis]
MIETEPENFSALFYDNEYLTNEQLRDLFSKCANFDAEMDDKLHHSFAICNQIIYYFETTIFDKNPNNDLIELLKKNFQEYFYLETDSDLSEKRLDFQTFKELLNKSIKQIRYSTEPKATQIKRNSYLCDKKLKNLRYSVSCSEKLSSIHTNGLEDEFRLKNSNEFRKIRLSNKSLSLSDHELNQSNACDLFDKDLKLELNRTRDELAELRSENFKLRDQIEILRDQLRLAEDTNAQIGTEFENQSLIISEHVKKNADFQSRILFYEKDIDDLRITNDELKKQLNLLTDQNINLNQMLEESSFLVKEKELQLTKVAEESQLKIKSYVTQHEEKKKIISVLQTANAELDIKNNELESKLSHFEEMISKPYWNDKDLKVEVDVLREKCSNLENEMKILNLKLSKKNSFADQNKENIRPPNSSENFPKVKINFSKKSKNKLENQTEKVDSKSFRSNGKQVSQLPNLNSFMLEQMETNLSPKELSKADFETVADSVEEFLKFTETIRRQHQDKFSKSDVLKLRDTNNNKTLEIKKKLSLMEQLFNYLILNDHNNFNNNLQKFIQQSKNYHKVFQTLSIENCLALLESNGKNMHQAESSSPKRNLILCDTEFGEKVEKSSDSLCPNESYQNEYFLISSPIEDPLFGPKTLNSTKHSESKILDKHKDLTPADTWYSKDNSISEKRRHNSISLDKNLTNFQISDLVNSRFTKSALDYSDLELNNDDEHSNSKYFVSSIGTRFINYLASNYQKLTKKIHRDPESPKMITKTWPKLL